MVAFAGAITGLLSRITRHLRILFPPEVTGLMVSMTGLQLVALGCPRFVGYIGPGSIPNVRTAAIGAATLITMVSIVLGELPWSQFLSELSEPWFSLPHRVAAGMSFRVSMLAPFLIASLTANLKTVGDLTLCQKINNADWKRTDMKSISGGILANGLGTLFSGLAGGVAQNTVSSSVVAGNGNHQPVDRASHRVDGDCSCVRSKAGGCAGRDARACYGRDADLFSVFHRDRRPATVDVPHAGRKAHFRGRNSLHFRAERRHFSRSI
jgi:xanthine/uracil permease